MTKILVGVVAAAALVFSATALEADSRIFSWDLLGDGGYTYLDTIQGTRSYAKGLCWDDATYYTNTITTIIRAGSTHDICR